MIGKIEFHDQKLVIGWAANPDEDGQDVIIEVVHNGTVLDTFMPTMFRWDMRGYHGFQYDLIQQFANRIPPSLEFRWQATGEPLDGSPIILNPLVEAQFIPFHTSDLTNNKVLVLAPHPDDETFACGGSLILHRQADDPVKVIFITDGALGDRVAKYSPDELVTMRQQEAHAACQILGVDDYEFWGFGDRTLAGNDTLQHRLANTILQVQPTLIYLPSPMEPHPDHRAVAAALWNMLQTMEKELLIAFADTTHPVNANTLIDITSVADKKWEAFSAYASQLENYPYLDVVRGYNRYRALTISPQSQYAESFYVAPSSRIKGKRIETFHRWQIIFDHSATDQLPLVSVVIRTKDRPLLLRDALSSVVTQSYADIEVIVVNDGGSDVQAVIDEFDGYLPIQLENVGESVGRAAAANRGIALANGQFINLLDDDDVLYADHINKLAKFLHTTAKTFAYSDCERGYYAWHDEQLTLREPKQPYMGVDYDEHRLYLGNYIPLMCVMFKRDLWEEVGGFDEACEYLEDWDLWLQMSALTSFTRLEGVTAQYRVIHPSQYDDTYWTQYVRNKHKQYWLEGNKPYELLKKLDDQRSMLQRLLAQQHESQQAQATAQQLQQTSTWRMVTRLQAWGSKTLPEGSRRKTIYSFLRDRLFRKLL